MLDEGGMPITNFFLSGSSWYYVAIIVMPTKTLLGQYPHAVHQHQNLTFPHRETWILTWEFLLKARLVRTGEHLDIF